MTENKNKISLEESLFSKEQSKTSKQKQRNLTTNTENNKSPKKEENKSNVADVLLLNHSEKKTSNTETTKKVLKPEKPNIILEKKLEPTSNKIEKIVKQNTNPSQQVKKDEVPQQKIPIKKNTNDSDKSIKKTSTNDSIAEKVIKSVSESKEIDVAIGKTYKTVKKVVSDVKTPVSSNTKKKKKKNKYKQGYSQNAIPIKSIVNGLIYTANGKYVKIVEVLPINYYALGHSSKERVSKIFGQLFHESNNYLHLKIITDKNNPQRLIQHIKEKCEEEKWQRGISDNVIACAQDRIDKIIALSEDNALTKRFFIIYEYEGKSTNTDEIYLEMESIKRNIVWTFSQSGNTVIDTSFEKSSFEMGEILYYFFNRKSCRKESFQDRITRITNDFNIYNMNSKTKKFPCDTDYIAPKGLHFKSPNYLYCDGSYRTYLALKDVGHPYYAYPGWLDFFAGFGDGTELDIHIKKLPHDITLSSLNQFTLFKTVSAEDKANNRNKQREMFSQIYNNTKIINSMQSGEDLFEVLIIITLSADSISELKSMKNIIEKQMNQKKYYTEDSYAQIKKFYRSTLPLTTYTMDLFVRNKRNYLTSSLESLYAFTSYEQYDPNGFMLGINEQNNSLVSVDLFNTNIFPNANTSIFGQSGSGKTFSTEVIARNMRIAGIRVFFILPIKGYEYERGCNAIDGCYIKLGPGMTDRINIMAIMPEQSIDRNALSEDVVVRKSSLLSKKIAWLVTWIQLLMPNQELGIDEVSEINISLTALYDRFGINEDDNSIYEDKIKKILKPMPIIGDMYDEFREHSELTTVCKILDTFVNGPCRNMNGQTNVDLTNNYTVFDVDESTMSKQLLASYLHIAFGCTYDITKQNRLELCAVFLDEVWKMMLNPSAAEQVGDMVRLIRGYGGAVIPVTQDINAYMNSSAGKTILSNTDTKLILKLKESECKIMGRELNLTEDEQNRIMSFQRGEGLLLAGRNRIFVRIEASDKEVEDFTTDPTILKQLALKKRQRLKMSQSDN